MALEITQTNRRESDDALNEDWFVLRNSGDAAISTRGFGLELVRPGAKRGKPVAKMDPGFRLEPGASRRVVCGNPATKAHGKAPEDDVENYYLLMKVALFRFPTGTLRVVKGQLAMASVDLAEVAGGE